MDGISSKAAGNLDNKRKWNVGSELNTDLSINLYETFYRNLDPQLGRFLQIDPKPNYSESLYEAMGDNPIKNMDFRGDTARTKADEDFLNKVIKSVNDKQEVLKEKIKEKEKQLADSKRLSKNKINTLTNKKNDFEKRLAILESSKQEIQNIKDDQKHGYSFFQDNFANHGYLYFEEDGGVIVHMMQGVDNALHEIDHAESFRLGLITPGGPLPTQNYKSKFPDEQEVTAYRKQYSYDPTGMPYSDSGYPDALDRINLNYYHGTDIYKQLQKDK
jgi:RHS repeat-associated protein